MGWRDMISFCPTSNFWTMFQGRPNEIELGCQHTIKSHGWELFKNHKHDWLTLILLAIIEITLYLMHPFYRFVGEGVMADLKYPMKDDTVPVWAVPLYSILLPFAIFLLYYIRRRDVYDLHHAILGILFAVLITGVLTDAIKNAVGRPRPDFFWRCFPDGNFKYDQWGDVVCHGKDSDLKEGHKSFPSGHTSWSFAGLGFLSLYLSGKKSNALIGEAMLLNYAFFSYPFLLHVLLEFLAWTTISITGKMCLSEVSLVLLWLRFATCSSSHLHTIHKDGVHTRISEQ